MGYLGVGVMWVWGGGGCGLLRCGCGLLRCGCDVGCGRWVQLMEFVKIEGVEM